MKCQICTKEWANVAATWDHKPVIVCQICYQYETGETEMKQPNYRAYSQWHKVHHYFDFYAINEKEAYDMAIRWMESLDYNPKRKGPAADTEDGEAEFVMTPIEYDSYGRIDDKRTFDFANSLGLVGTIGYGVEL